MDGYYMESGPKMNLPVSLFSYPIQNNEAPSASIGIMPIGADTGPAPILTLLYPTLQQVS